MLSIANKAKEYEEIYKGREVLATDGQKSFYGIFDKIKEGTVYLKPSIVFENLAGKNKGEWEYNPVLNKEVPTTFSFTPNISFQAYSKGYLKRLIKSYDKWKLSEKSDKENK